MKGFMHAFFEQLMLELLPVEKDPIDPEAA
jgi:hypothetical protein